MFTIFGQRLINSLNIKNKTETGETIVTDVIIWADICHQLISKMGGVS